MKYNLIYIVIIFAFISCEKEVSVSQPDLPPPKGVISISSYPHDFIIYMNGKNRIRRTPDSLKWLATDSYQIMLKKDLFLDSTFIVSVVDGQRSEIFVDFSANPKMLGDLLIESKPQGAEIFINDSNTFKTTPSSFVKLLPNYYKITLKKNNYEDIKIIAAVKSSRRTELKKAMVDTTIWNYFHKDNSDFSTNSFTSVAVDYNNVKWFGSDQGLFRYDQFGWKVFTPDNSLMPHKVINKIIVDEENIKWICTNDGVGSINYDQTFLPYSPRNSSLEPGSVVTGLILPSFSINGEVQKPRYYFVNKNNIALRSYNVKEKYWQWSNINDATIQGSITTLSIQGIYFVIGSETSGFIVLFFDESKKFTVSSSIVPSNSISCMVAVQDGIWIGHRPEPARSGGITYFSNNTVTVYKFGFPTPNVNTIYVDKNNNKWVGTDIGLYYFLDFENRILINEENTGMPLNNITEICEDLENNIWLTSSSDGIFMIKNKEKLFQSLNQN